MKVVGFVVMSLDGCLTRHEEPGVGFASEADRRYFHQALAEFDCTLMGHGTFEARRDAILGALSPRRLRVVWTRHPDRHSAEEQAGLLEFRDGKPSAILDRLAERGYSGCAVLGGAALFTACLEERRMPELWVTIEPRVFGTGQRMFAGHLDQAFGLRELAPLSADTVLLKYQLREEHA